MPQWFQQFSFNGGEFSRRLESRADQAKYQIACRTLENFIASPYGGIPNRPGTEFIAAAKTSATKARLLPFRFSTDTNFLLEFTDQAVRFYSNGLQVQVSAPAAWVDATVYALGDQVAHNSVNYVCIEAHTAADGATPGADDGAGDNEPGIGEDAPDVWHALSGTILELPMPYLTAELFEVQFLQVKDIFYLIHPNHAPRRLIRLADDQWTIEATDFGRPALLDENVNPGFLMACSHTSGSSRTLMASGTGNAPFTADHVGAYFEISHRRSDPWVAQAISANASSSALWCHGTVTLKTTGTWDATVRIEEQDSAGNWDVIRSWDGSSDRNLEVVFTQEVPRFLRITIASYASNTNATARLECQDPIQRGLVLVTGYTSATQVTVDVIETLSSTGTTDLWAEGAWSDHQGFPRAIALHEDRVWYAGTASEPLRVWGSQVGDYENFLLGVTDVDAVDFTLASPRNNLIQWMISQQGSLVIGTSGGEFLMRSQSETAAITPSNVSTQQQSNYGSEFLQALLVNDSLVFTQRIGRRLLDYFYDWERNGRRAGDLTLYAEHATLGGVLQLDFSQQPLPILWAVTGEGVLVGVTYDRGQEVLAVHRHVTNGEFESVAVIPGEQADEVWCTVKRTIDGSTVRYVERIEPYTMWHHIVSTDDNATDAALFLFSDSGLKITQTASDTVTGLEHLEGEEVALMVDGSTHPVRTVSGGSITLEREGSQISVGLQFTPILETLPRVALTGAGSTKGKQARIHRAILDVFRSRAAEYTPHGSAAADDKWHEVYFRNTSDLMDTPPPLATEGKDVTALGDYSKVATFAIRNVEPQPLTILSLTLIWDTFDTK